MMSNLVDYDRDSVAIGQQVVITYGAVNDDITLPLFRPAPS
jgi:hypothetical protein